MRIFRLIFLSSIFLIFANKYLIANKHRPTGTMLWTRSNLRGLISTRFNSNKTQTSSLKIMGNKIESFPRCSESNFSKLRSDPGFAYFDRTRYLSILNSARDRAILFLRPRRFGKSLTISMLEHFHGIQHQGHYNELFKVFYSDSIHG